MPRTELTPEELNIHKQAISSAIRKDFLKKDVSYQQASDIKYISGYARETENSKSLARQILKDDFNASVVAVGNGQVAIVKRAPK